MPLIRLRKFPFISGLLSLFWGSGLSSNLDIIINSQEVKIVQRDSLYPLPNFSQ